MLRLIVDGKTIEVAGMTWNVTLVGRRMKNDTSEIPDKLIFYNVIRMGALFFEVMSESKIYSIEVWGGDNIAWVAAEKMFELFVHIGKVIDESKKPKYEYEPIILTREEQAFKDRNFHNYEKLMRLKERICAKRIKR